MRETRIYIYKRIKWGIKLNPSFKFYYFKEAKPFEEGLIEGKISIEDDILIELVARVNWVLIQFDEKKMSLHKLYYFESIFIILYILCI